MAGHGWTDNWTTRHGNTITAPPDYQTREHHKRPTRPPHHWTTRHSNTIIGKPKRRITAPPNGRTLLEHRITEKPTRQMTKQSDARTWPSHPSTDPQDKRTRRHHYQTAEAPDYWTTGWPDMSGPLDNEQTRQGNTITRPADYQTREPTQLGRTWLDHYISGDNVSIGEVKAVARAGPEQGQWRG